METIECITTEYGTRLQMNCSIKAEGSFAVVKEDIGLRQYLYRGRANVLAQSVLAAISCSAGSLVIINSSKTYTLKPLSGDM